MQLNLRTDVLLVGMPALCLVFALLAGCGGGGEGGPYYSTTGKVTMDGAPLASATVEFLPTKSGQTAIGFTDDEGNYVMLVRETRGCAPGDYIVSISSFAEGEEVENEGNEGDSKVEGGSPETVPSSYRGQESKLRAKVTSDGDNVFNFDLKSDGS